MKLKSIQKLRQQHQDINHCIECELIDFLIVDLFYQYIALCSILMKETIQFADY